VRFSVDLPQMIGTLSHPMLAFGIDGQRIS
jgi:hypothetical protein